MRKENIMDESYRHVWLYAKNWYKRSGDIIGDLKRILGERYNIPPEYLLICDIIEELLSVVHPIILNSKYKFREFAIDLRSCNRWQYGAEGESFDLVLIKKCLSIIKCAKVKGIIELGEPDPSILPLNKH